MASALDLVFIFSGLVVIYYFLIKKKQNLPPGPWNIPFLSGIYTAGAYPHITFQQWAKKYGPLIRTKYGFKDALIIDDAKLVREAFNHPAFNGRTDNRAFTEFSGGKHGIVSGEGQEWAEQRRFVLRSLRDFGFGKKSMEGLIMEEIHEFLKWMKENEGVPTEVKPRLVLATVGTLWTMMAGERQNQDDTKLQHMIDSVTEVFNDVGQSAGLFILFPELLDILPKFMLKSWENFTEKVKPVLQYFSDAVEDHIEHPVDASQPRDLIDVYLQEVKKTTDPNSSFYGARGHKMLETILSDLYGAGAGTTSSLIAWTILYLIRFPHVQKKFQKELDTVVGKNRLPTLADRPNLPFTEALTMEVMRFASLTPLGVFHETTEDATLVGYDIRKGTVIIPNFYSINHSKQIYGDPEQFRPERFLSSDGKTVTKNQDLMPFSTGKRQCLGETMGRDNYFLFITTIFQRFDIAHDPSRPMPNIQAPPGFFLEPEKFFAIFKERVF